MNMFHKRQGQVDVNFCYFYTDTIFEFRHLLADDALKHIVISSLQYLTEKKLVTLYGFVIMPNHIHLLWYMLKNNGKETPAGSFAKFLYRLVSPPTEKTKRNVYLLVAAGSS